MGMGIGVNGVIIEVIVRATDPDKEKHSLETDVTVSSYRRRSTDT